MEAKQVTTTHTCKVCGKGFSSGKAFGGHWRSHLQKARRAAKEDHDHDHDHHVHAHHHHHQHHHQTVSNSGEPNHEPLPCSICDKGFSSMKALGGHMRSHPERDWRGINPPPPPPRGRTTTDVVNPPPPLPPPSDEDHSNDDDDDDDDDNTDLTRSLLPSWMRREKRGRGRDSELVDAAEVLLGLSRVSKKIKKKQKTVPSTPPSFEGFKAKANSSLRLKIITTSSSNSNTSRDVNNVTCYTNFPKGKQVVVAAASADIYRDVVIDDDQKKKTDHEGSSTNNGNDHHDQKITFDGDDDDSVLYKCVDCGKSFSTFQGLGGHRSTHNKHLMSNKKSSGVINNITISPNSLLADHHEKKKKKKKLKNQFQVVKVISNNGHDHHDHHHQKKDMIVPRSSTETRRRDWITGSPSDLPSAATGLSFRGGQRVLDFDLNELPCAKSR